MLCIISYTSFPIQLTPRNNKMNENKLNDFLPFLEYKKDTPILITEFNIPWLNKTNNKLTNKLTNNNNNSLINLHCEIINFSNLMSLSNIEMLKREEIIENMKKIILKLFPNCQIYIFGSHITKILTPKSDIDIVSLFFSFSFIYFLLISDLKSFKSIK